MDRRNLLEASDAGLVATVLPGWLARGFASREVGALPALGDDLGRALDRARELGLPVIVFVVPKDAQARWDRSEVLADALHGFGGSRLAGLELAELVCAGADDVARRFPEVDDGTEPLAYVIDKDLSRANVRRVDVELAPWPRAQRQATQLDARGATWSAPFLRALRGLLPRRRPSHLPRAERGRSRECRATRR